MVVPCSEEEEGECYERYFNMLKFPWEKSNKKYDDVVEILTSIASKVGKLTERVSKLEREQRDRDPDYKLYLELKKKFEGGKY